MVTNPKPTTFTRAKKEALPREFSTVGALLRAGFRVFPVKRRPDSTALSSGQEDPGPRWPQITPGISLHCAESITWHKGVGENRDQLEH